MSRSESECLAETVEKQNTIIKMQSGVVGTFHINADSAMADEAYFLIYGTKGILSLPDPNQFGREVTFIPQPPVLWERGEPVVLTNYNTGTPVPKSERGCSFREPAFCYAGGCSPMFR